MPRPVPVRGVIEGFYGAPWSHEARLHMIEFIGAHDMNAYVYAPKDDEKHRARWRDSYDVQEAARFAELAAASARCGVRFGFALSPGLDVGYADPADREALTGKLQPLLDLGVDWFVLALDDIPPRAGLAGDQADLATWLLDALRKREPGVRLTFVPTEYVGTRPSPYLHELDAGLPDDLDVMWTGPTVCSPRITAEDARGWRAALGGRPLLLWDNYPVNDGAMSRELHLGPYRGRAPDITDVVDGVLCNPMIEAHASKIPIAVAAEFLRAPDRFDERAAWERAIDEVGGSRAPALGTLARACASGPLLAPEELDARALLDTLVVEMDGPGWQAPVSAMRDELTALRTAGAAWRDAPDDPLAVEVRRWTTKAALEADAGLAALRLLQQVRPVAATRADDGDGCAAAPDADLALVHVFALLFAWTTVRDASPEVVLGPRFSFHPAVVQLPDGRAAVNVRLALCEDASVIDQLCRLALDHYAHWTTLVPEPVRVMTAEREATVAADGRFNLDHGAVVVLVRSGPLVTRLAGEDAPPFPDARLS